MIDFDSFSNRWEISAKLTLVTPMRIGGGQNAGAYSLSQAPVMLSYDAQTEIAEPFIPGSSLKGVLRSTVERIVRTFNEKEACIGVGNKKTDRVLCGEYDVCSVFGSQEAGASIRVQDAHLSSVMGNKGVLEERPHCSTEYELKAGHYVMKKKNNKVPKTQLRQEEIVASNTSFDIKINLDNADEKDVGMIILALNEFNHKRCHLGGGVSRGNGFAEVFGIRVKRKIVSSNPEKLFQIETESIDPYHFCDVAKKYLRKLRKIDDRMEVERRDFDVYYKAYKGTESEGTFVVKYNVETLTDFQMPGADEVTVTSRGVPVIPGSTIKGFLRHKLIADRVPADTVDEIFGSVKGNNQHRGRIIVSDAYPESDFPGNDKIPEGTNLTMWIVFDNIKTEEFKLIDDILSKPQVITGNTAAGKTRKSNSFKNQVKFVRIESKRFDAEEFLKQ
jgi:CRISPR-associated protein Csm3